MNEVYHITNISDIEPVDFTAWDYQNNPAKLTLMEVAKLLHQWDKPIQVRKIASTKYKVVNISSALILEMAKIRGDTHIKIEEQNSQ